MTQIEQLKFLDPFRNENFLLTFVPKIVSQCVYMSNNMTVQAFSSVMSLHCSVWMNVQRDQNRKSSHPTNYLNTSSKEGGKPRRISQKRQK